VRAIGVISLAARTIFMLRKLPRRIAPAKRKVRRTAPTFPFPLFDRLLHSPHLFPRFARARMTLGNLLSVDQILPEMKATERWSAIVELVDLLVERGQIRATDRDVVLAALRQREETMSTGIGFGIAIPHASSDRVDHVVAAFGRSSSGIEFDSLDNAPVRFIVLFVVPKDQFQTHLRTLAAIAKFLNDRSVRERLGSAASAGEILSIFESTAPARA
jgi:mannitol/fructose-specific phosphotransferase system IIA component (Ntr-type)